MRPMHALCTFRIFCYCWQHTINHQQEEIPYFGKASIITFITKLNLQSLPPLVSGFVPHITLLLSLRHCCRCVVVVVASLLPLGSSCCVIVVCCCRCVVVVVASLLSLCAVLLLRSCRYVAAVVVRGVLRCCCAINSCFSYAIHKQLQAVYFLKKFVMGTS